MKFIYAWYYKHGKINEKQALFESFHGKDVSDSSLAILQEFLKMPASPYSYCRNAEGQNRPVGWFHDRPQYLP